MLFHVHTYVTIFLNQWSQLKGSASSPLSSSLHLQSRFRPGRKRASLSSFLCSSWLMHNAHHKAFSKASSASGMDYETTQKYVMLNNNQNGIQPPPQRRKIPRYHSHNRSSGGSCCVKCMCCCCCFLIIFILLLALSFYIVYEHYKPRVPSYDVDDFEVKAFDLQLDFSLYSEFHVYVKASNPNRNIGLNYGKKSSVLVLYKDSTLCSGQLPAFHQPVKNTTTVEVVLKGKSEFGSGLQEAFMENRHSGSIPLLIRVKAPISVVLGDFPLKPVVVNVNVSLVVDNLSPNKKVNILSTKYRYGVRF